MLPPEAERDVTGLMKEIFHYVDDVDNWKSSTLGPSGCPYFDRYSMSAVLYVVQGVTVL